MHIIGSRELGERDGFELVAYKVVDEHTSIDEFDCYEEVDVAAYHADQWSFVGVIVRACKRGIELAEDSIWGVEDGYSPGFAGGGWTDAFDHTLSEDDNDVPGEAIHRAKAVLAELCKDERPRVKRWPVRRRTGRW